MPLDDISKKFYPSANPKVTSEAKSSHPVERGTLAGSEKTWIKKTMGSSYVAKIECMSQEFFRLLIPHQPETRLLLNPQTNTHYILSEEVPGYRALPESQASFFYNGTYTGLGQIVVGSMFLQEIDLKNGNIGLDNQNRVTKIDGDWCFAAHRYSQGCKFAITPESISSLPYINGFYAFNWLDLITQGVFNEKSVLVDSSLIMSPIFKNEVNQALLKICLLPDHYIKCFVKQFMPDSRQPFFIELIKKRRDELQASALLTPSFQAYLKTPLATTDAIHLIEQMNHFMVNGQTLVVIPTERETMTALTFQRMDFIKPLMQEDTPSITQQNDDAIDNYDYSPFEEILEKFDMPSDLRDSLVTDELREIITRLGQAVAKQRITMGVDATAEIDNVVSHFIDLVKAGLSEDAFASNPVIKLLEDALLHPGQTLTQAFKKSLSPHNNSPQQTLESFKTK